MTNSKNFCKCHVTGLDILNRIEYNKGTKQNKPNDMKRRKNNEENTDLKKHGWFFDEDTCAIVDADDNYLEQHGNHKLIWQYVPYAEYTYHR